jgi:hypothetical protein
MFCIGFRLRPLSAAANTPEDRFDTAGIVEWPLADEGHGLAFRPPGHCPRAQDPRAKEALQALAPIGSIGQNGILC